ncbi:hypothetical protein [Flavobacterium sp. AG291]|uniref:hypothetical protein n=1 Tax=Flavobacterium sp. AG291 TaxID=2184000 RepID=UPI000E0C83BF|nr:hypothetical protein [Flavobacterium sp. AG291]RDI06935.1 hypothetical protein DEU42_11334 [Flavobacterium sp. AG291]
MKNTFKKGVRRVQLVTAGKSKNVYHLAFQKKNSIIRYIEIIAVCAIAFIMGAGFLGYFN